VGGRGLAPLAGLSPAALQYQPFPVASPWNPLTASGAGRYLNGFIVLLWFASLFLNAHLSE